MNLEAVHSQVMLRGKGTDRVLSSVLPVLSKLPAAYGTLDNVSHPQRLASTL
ncbi:hypothetical protein LPH50_11575 [Xylella taiwanensis]|uniref:Uncharacterized protein n=1 Tax=Xylella taiwanensis TaxID=1444770 RepID=A0ABS8TUS8_9GAMM|nr:hypothetical protein [Xylella taiwanensis]MCD8456564.1 hypothetical protein [Xylella taiwanensis]MCD8458971.1 hypothetical protein [Xylella taiwanensis]MCD8461110.1 hypothetical protein [Xylella taiwanensis]MCD8462831.1 hypothetical protein [Xylella taiwanensis]MCD8465615.1 hypothetical protein [Xylella taiwanensis]